MDTDQVLDLFDVTTAGDTGKSKGKEKKMTQKELLEGLAEVDEDEYGFEQIAAGL